MATRRVNFAVAGQNFGFDLPEISSGGTENTKSVLMDYFPELKLSFGTSTGKTTRGGRLGRQSLPVTPEVTFKQAISATPTTPKVFEGKIGSATIEDIGGKGFGMKDYSAAIEAGYSPESIKDYVIRNKETLYNIGPEAQKTLGITGYVSTQPGAYNYATLGGPGFGMKDIEELQQRGVGTEAMRKLAAQAPVVGQKAAEFLGYSPSETQLKAKEFLTSFNPATAGGPGFGIQDIYSLREQGADSGIMKILASQAPRVGPDAAQILGYTPTAAQTENLRLAQTQTPAPTPSPAPTPAPTPAPAPQRQPWEDFDYAAYGQSGFGMEDLNALEQMNAPLKTIREIATRAPGGQIGPEARRRLGL